MSTVYCLWLRIPIRQLSINISLLLVCCKICCKSFEQCWLIRFFYFVLLWGGNSWKPILKLIKLWNRGLRTLHIWTVALLAPVWPLTLKTYSQQVKRKMLQSNSYDSCMFVQIMFGLMDIFILGRQGKKGITKDFLQCARKRPNRIWQDLSNSWPAFSCPIMTS